MDDFLACRDGQDREFSTVCTKIRESQNEVLTMSAESGMNAEQICESYNLCGDVCCYFFSVICKNCEKTKYIQYKHVNTLYNIYNISGLTKILMQNMYGIQK